MARCGQYHGRGVVLPDGDKNSCASIMVGGGSSGGALIGSPKIF